MKTQTVITGLLSTLFVTVSLCDAQTLNTMLSEQIASHFEQVFSDEGRSFNDRDSWLPGSDKEPVLFGMDFELSASVTWVAPSEIEGTDHDASVCYNEASYSLSYPFMPGKKLGFVAKVSNYSISESEGNYTPVFDYDHIKQVDLGLMYSMNLSPMWDVFLGGGSIFSDGNGFRQKSSSNYMVFVGATFTISPNLTIATAVNISSNNNYYQSAIPMFILEWRINDRNRLSVRNGILYQYALTEDWKNVMGFSIEGFTVSVDEKEVWIDGKLHAEPTRVVSDISFNLTYAHQFENGLSFISKVGLGHFADHSLWDGHKKLSTVDLDYSMGVSVGLGYKF